MAARLLEFVLVEHPEIKGEPLMIDEAEYDEKAHKIWTGDLPEGTVSPFNKTADYQPAEKPAPKAKAKPKAKK